MRHVFVVKVDSFSDVITNSSTDIFACKSEKSVKAIEELLNEIATVAGETAGLTVEEQTIEEFWNKTKDFCILDMGYDYVFDKDYNQKGWTYENKYGIIKKEMKTGELIPEDKIFDEWISRYKSYFTSMEFKSNDKNYGKDVTKETKIIVICGTDDNSIPYWIQEFIQDRMHAVRYHLG